MNIQTLVLDVDGVINGSLVGTNTPFPSQSIIKKLQEFISLGGNIIFCTSKGVYPIVEMVNKFDLHGIHIADAGGIIWNSVENKFEKNSFSEQGAKDIIELLTETGKYFEVYKPEGWYIEKGFVNPYIKAHSELLRCLPTETNLLDLKVLDDVSKFIYFDEKEPHSVDNINLIKKLSEYATKWTVSPVLAPASLMIITPKGISKANALKSISEKHNIDLGKAIGVGDHHSDWKFMQICKYQGVMGNSTDELIELANKNINTSFIGKSVDEDGLLDILKYVSI